jgi:hypothetical protein
MSYPPEGPPGAAPQSDPKENLSGTAEKAQEAVKRQGGRLAEEARGVAEDAKAAAASKAEETKSRTAEEFARTAHALETAAEELGESSAQREILRRAAAGLQDVSDIIRGRSFGEMVDELTRFGRRNPAVLLGGAALAGFALARFGRASAPDRGYGSASRGYGSETRGYGPETRGYGSETRGYGSETRGYGQESRGYGSESSDAYSSTTEFPDTYPRSSSDV